jgi:hypothetical protein
MNKRNSPEITYQEKRLVRRLMRERHVTIHGPSVCCFHPVALRPDEPSAGEDGRYIPIRLPAHWERYAKHLQRVRGYINPDLAAIPAPRETPPHLA